MAAEEIADHIDQDPDPHDEEENSDRVGQKVPEIKTAFEKHGPSPSSVANSWRRRFDRQLNAGGPESCFCLAYAAVKNKLRAVYRTARRRGDSLNDAFTMWRQS